MKKVVIVLVVLFLGFWMLTDAAGFADASKTAGGAVWGLTTDFFDGLIDFFDAL